MSYLADPRSFRRTTAGAALIISPLLLLATETIHPEPKSDPADLFAVATANADRWYLAHALALVAIAAAIPAILGLMHLLRASRPVWGHVAAALAFLGLVPLCAIVGTEFVLWQMTALDSPTMVQLVERLNESGGVAIVFLSALLFPLGFGLFGVGLYLARVVPAWQAALLGISLPLVFVGDLAYVKPLTVVGAAMFALGAVPLGWQILNQTDDEWEVGSARETYRPVTAA